MTTKFKALSAVVALAALAVPAAIQSQTTTTNATIISVDVNANRHPISPEIYGVNYGYTGSKGINAPLNRMGGNNMSRYNPELNADSKGSDFFYESISTGSAVPYKHVDDIIDIDRTQGARTMVTVPMLGYVAKLSPTRGVLGSYSTTKYGAQQAADGVWGNGILKANGAQIANNNPLDASVVSSVSFIRPYVEHLVRKYGTARDGGVKYYLLDNEPGIWYATHRDVIKTGLKMRELVDRSLPYAALIKDSDPTAQVAGPEEWGWPSYILSSYDLQKVTRTDMAANGGVEQVAFYLKSFAQADALSGRRTLDVFSLHYYPQAGEYGDDVSVAKQNLRNRSTRGLWDPNYKDESYIPQPVRLIPRMKEWVANNYPGTKTAITEYTWGAESHINGATAQADVLGIFGREGLDIATRWAKPYNNTVTYKAYQMYRNYDGQNGMFGDVSVSCVVPNPDNLSAFASQDSVTGAVKIMVINKALPTSGPAKVTLNLAGFMPADAAGIYQLTAGNKINRLDDAAVDGGSVSLTVPAQSITLLIIPKNGAVSTSPPAVPPPPPAVPAAPSVLSAVALSYDRIRLNWTDKSDNETSFEIQRSNDNVTFSPLTTVAANVATFENKGLTNNRTYYYRVRAVNSVGKSAFSNVAQATTAK